MAEHKNCEGHFLALLHVTECDVLIGEKLENVFVVNNFS